MKDIEAGLPAGLRDRLSAQAGHVCSQMQGCVFPGVCFVCPPSAKFVSVILRPSCQQVEGPASLKGISVDGAGHAAGPRIPMDAETAVSFHPISSGVRTEPISRCSLVFCCS